MVISDRCDGTKSISNSCVPNSGFKCRATLTPQAAGTPLDPRIFDGEKEARLVALACSKPPEGHAKWSLRLLEEKVVEPDIVARASDNTIGRTLKKIFSNRI